MSTISTTNKQFTTILKFCQNKNIDVDEDKMKKFVSCSSTLEKLNSMNDKYAIVEKTDCAVLTGSCTDVNVYFKQLDFIIRIDSSILNNFVLNFKEEDPIYFKPTIFTEEEFKQFIDFIEPYSIYTSLLVCLQYENDPSVSEKEDILIKKALDHDNDITFVQTILKPIIDVDEGRIKQLQLRKMFDDEIEKREASKKLAKKKSQVIVVYAPYNRYYLYDDDSDDDIYIYYQNYRSISNKPYRW